jgi:CheY-like chemotaxis protein
MSHELHTLLNVILVFSELMSLDDNSDNRLLLTTLLKNVGFEVRKAENDQQAVEAF